MKKIIFLFLLFSVTCFAYEKVTEYDFNIEQVFTGKTTFPLTAFESDFSITSFYQSLRPQTIQINSSEIFNSKLELNIELKKLNLDWSIIADINAETSTLWNTLSSCAENDIEKAKLIYRDTIKTECPQAYAQLIQIKNKLYNFLNTTDTGQLSLYLDLPETIISCTVKIGTDNECPYSTIFSQLKGKNDSKSAPYYDQITQNTNTPNLHPLFIQILLEAIARDHRLAFGTWWKFDCTILFLCPHEQKSIVDSKPDDWLNISGNYVPIRYDVLIEYFKSGTISEENKKLISYEELGRIRRDFVAVKILSLLILGKPNCQKFGLWPEATAKLLQAMIGSSDTYVDIGWFLAVSQESFFDKLTAACALPNKKLYFGRWMQPGSDTDIAADILSNAGAWRALEASH